MSKFRTFLPAVKPLYIYIWVQFQQEKHHVWVQTARLYLHLICIISNKYQNSGIFSKTKRKPEKVAKHT